MSEREILILLVEDNPGDVLLTKEAMKDIRMLNRIETVADGEEALDYMFKRGQHISALTPDLILLDLNIPKVSGLEVLKQVKAEEGLKHIPVVVLTSSSADLDILTSYKSFANAYVQKPVTLDGFHEIVTKLEGFWFKLVKLPSEVGQV